MKMWLLFLIRFMLRRNSVAFLTPTNVKTAVSSKAHPNSLSPSGKTLLILFSICRDYSRNFTLYKFHNQNYF